MSISGSDLTASSALIELFAGSSLSRALDAAPDVLGDPDLQLQLWLWDHGRQAVCAFGGDAEIGRDEMSAWAAEHSPVAVVVHGEPIGHLTVTGGAPAEARQLAGVVAPLIGLAIRSSMITNDRVHTARRRRELSLPAELQWSLLPADTFVRPNVRLSAGLEPAYETGGDVYDYAEYDGRLFLALLDAQGHGLRAATTSAVAMAAMRKERRAGSDLAAIAHAIGRAIRSPFDTDNFVTAVMVDLDMATGRGTWLGAAHPAPLIVDADGAIRELAPEPALPLGISVAGQVSSPVTRQLEIDVGERLVLFTDGMIDNVDEPYETAVARVHDVLSREIVRADAGVPAARRVVEELTPADGTGFRDDATLVIVERTTAD